MCRQMATSTDNLDRHDIVLRDIREGEAVVSYRATKSNRSAQVVRHVSARLPVECLTLFDGGVVDVADLTAEEQAWLEAESTPNTIDFEGVRV